MTAIYGQANAPHLVQPILVASNRRFNLAQTGHPLAAIAPKTRLSRVALDLAVESSRATVQLIAINV